MDARKDYVAPAIAAEDMLEQTSLACTATAGLSDVIQPVCFAGEGNFTQVCAINVAKGGAFIGLDVFCTVKLVLPKDLVVLS